MASAVPTASAALVAMIGDALADQPEVLICYGHPGPTPAEDIVALMAAESTTEPTVMQIGPRPLDETLDLTVVVSCWRGGGLEVQPAVTDRAYSLADVIDTTVRGDPTLRGSVWSAHVAAIVQAPVDDPELLATGRLAELSVTVHAQART